MMFCDHSQVWQLTLHPSKRFKICKQDQQAPVSNICSHLFVQHLKITFQKSCCLIIEYLQNILQLCSFFIRRKNSSDLFGKCDKTKTIMATQTYITHYQRYIDGIIQ